MPYCYLCGSPLEQRDQDGARRWVCSSADCDYVHWDNPVPVVAAIVELEGHVVLARNKQWLPGVYSVITGYLEKGETPENAVLREVEEELGLRGDIRSYIGCYPYFEKNQLILAYAVAAQGEITLGAELVEYKLIPRDKLRPWDFGTGPAVKDWLAQESKRTHNV